MTQDYMPFPEIISALKKLCQERVTGTIFIATKKNRSAQLILDRGEIVFVYFFNKRGEEALELMATISAGRYRFQEGAVTRRMDLPPTDVILQNLAGQSAGEQIRVSSTAAAVGPGLSQEQKDVIESCLAGFIGPMAGIICEDHLGVAADLQAAIDALVTEIPSAEQAQKFKAMVMQKLG